MLTFQIETMTFKVASALSIHILFSLTLNRVKYIARDVCVMRGNEMSGKKKESGSERNKKRNIINGNLSSSINLELNIC